MDALSPNLLDGPGRDLARRVTAALMGAEGTAAAWGLELEDVGIGYARVAMRITNAMLNGHGNAHGGMIFAFGATAFAYACNADNIVTVAQQCSISFLSPGRADERIVAEARQVARVGRAGSYSIIITGDGGRVIAHMQGLSRAMAEKVIDEEETNG